MEREGWVKHRESWEKLEKKKKTLLGLVSNLQQLSNHQRKTAYSEGTVRGCLPKRITALKGSEAKQQHHEFRCSCRVGTRRGGVDTVHQETHYAPVYYSSTLSIHHLLILFVCEWGVGGGVLGCTLMVSLPSFHYSTGRRNKFRSTQHVSAHQWTDTAGFPSGRWAAELPVALPDLSQRATGSGSSEVRVQPVVPRLRDFLSAI